MVSSWEGVKMIHLFICLSFFQISWRNKKLQAKKWQISYWHRSATGFLLIHKYPDFSSLKTDSIILLLTWSPLHVYSLSAPKGELPKITLSRRKVDHKFKSLMSITDLNLVNNWSLIKGSKLLSSGLCWSFTISLWVFSSHCRGPPGCTCSWEEQSQQHTNQYCTLVIVSYWHIISILPCQ